MSPQAWNYSTPQELGKILPFLGLLGVFSQRSTFSSSLLSGAYESGLPLWVCLPFLSISYPLVLL